MTAVSGSLLAEPPPVAPMTDQLVATIAWTDPTPLFRGRCYLLGIGPRPGAATIVATVTAITREADDPHPARELRRDESGRITLALSEPVPFDPGSATEASRRFVLLDRATGATLGAGILERAARAAGEVRAQSTSIRKPARAALKGQRPAVLWFTGLSGAGKSTLADLVERELHASAHHTMLLDGDNVRHGLNRDLGFSEADRVENIRRVAEVARLFVEAGLIVLVSFISPYRAERLLARERVDDGEFIEIFVDTPIAECRRRDPKGLYARADAGAIRNFTGIDSPYEPPAAPEIHLRTLSSPPDRLASLVMDDLRRRGVIG